MGAILSWVQNNSPAVVIFIGALFAAGGGIYSAARQSQSDAKAKEQQTLIAKQNDKIIELAHENSKLSNVILNNLIGGDGYCYTNMFSVNSQGFAVINSSPYPLYEVAMRIVDLDLFNESEKSGKHDYMGESYQIGTIPGNAVSMVAARRAFAIQEGKKYNIFFSARNGFWSQTTSYYSKSTSKDLYEKMEVDRSPNDGSSERLLYKDSGEN